jgi:hypothetical protein
MDGTLNRMTAWRDYQERTADFFRALGMDANVEERVVGARGQHYVDVVDVVVRTSRAGIEQLWVVECKWWRRSVSKLYVAVLGSAVQDVGADRGILLSETAFQAGARTGPPERSTLITDYSKARGAGKVGPKQDLMTTLLAVFATFTALGSAVIGYVAATQVSVAEWTVNAEEIAKPRPGLLERALGSPTLRARIVVAIVTAVAGFVLLGNGLGLLFSILWLRADAANSVDGWSWTYSWAVNLSVGEAVALTLGMLAAVTSTIAQSARNFRWQSPKRSRRLS